MERGLEVGLQTEESRCVAVLKDLRRPVVRYHHVHLRGIRQQLEDLKTTVVEGCDISRVHRPSIERNALSVPAVIVHFLVNAGQPPDGQALIANHVGASHEIDVWSDPSPVMQFVLIVDRFVIASHIDCEDGSLGFFVIVLEEIHLQ